MMTFEEKITNIDPEPRDDRYYIIMNMRMAYQTDDVDDLCNAVNIACYAWLKKFGKDTEKGLPVSFEEAVPCEEFPRPGIAIRLHEDLENPVLICLVYGVSVDDWKARQPEWMIAAAADTPEEIIARSERLH